MNENIEQMVNENTYSEIDLKNIFKNLFESKFTIFTISSLFAIFSIIYSLYLPNIYQSQALLAPVQERQSSMSSFGQAANLASLAGISLGSSSAGDKSVEAIERIKSFDFFSKFFLPSIKLEDLMAVDSWNNSNNQLLYEEDSFDSDKNVWLTGIPSEQQAYGKYREKMSISQDKKTSFVTISIKHKSPNIAKRWTENIIEEINRSMREEEKNKVTNSIEFLNNQISSVNYNEIKQSISSLLEEQMKSLMLIEADENYIFKVISSPISPEKKSEPRRSIIVMLSTFFGFILSIIYVLIFKSKSKK